MCGIVGYFGRENVENMLIQKLKLLEYRGYDSSGIAVKSGEKFKVTKAKGEIANLEKIIEPLEGANIGIAHTRWATHGVPCEVNAHPHLSMDNEWAIVHNGIIENYGALKNKLTKRGYEFVSETDTEIVATLIEYYRKKHNVTNNLNAIIRACSKLEGSYALAVLNKNRNKIYFAKNKCPLYCAVKGEEFMLASDPICFVGFADEYYSLENKEYGYYGDGTLVFSDDLFQQIEKKPVKLDCSAYNFENDYKHFMIKEIYEVKDSIKNVIEYYSDQSAYKRFDEINFGEITDIKIVGCGTAYHAGLVGAKIIEKQLGVECNAYVASEFRYMDPKVGKNSLVILVSQSGETADTLAAEELSRKKGAKTLAVVNVEYSALAKTADYFLPIKAGVEIAVASTKAYAAQIAVLYLVAARIKRNLSLGETPVIEELEKLKKAVTVKDVEHYKMIADMLQYQQDLFMIGRGADYCTAQEACLKIKETSYINANTYYAGELKHGFLALIEENTYVCVFASDKNLLLKTLANAEEAKSRGAKLILTTSCDVDECEHAGFTETIKVPRVNELLQPVADIVPWQIIAYYISVNRGLNPDKPRNLAKSVTVE